MENKQRRTSRIPSSIRRKERSNITIYLLSGVKLTGRIRSFDKYSVVLETNNQEQLIFKHAISTVAMGRTLHGAWGEANGVARTHGNSIGESGSGHDATPLRHRGVKCSSFSAGRLPLVLGPWLDRLPPGSTITC